MLLIGSFVFVITEEQPADEKTTQKIKKEAKKVKKEPTDDEHENEEKSIIFCHLFY